MKNHAPDSTVEIIDGTLLFGEATLLSTQIKHKARIIIRNRSNIILPEAEQTADPVMRFDDLPANHFHRYLRAVGDDLFAPAADCKAMMFLLLGTAHDAVQAKPKGPQTVSKQECFFNWYPSWLKEEGWLYLLLPE